MQAGFSRCEILTKSFTAWQASEWRVTQHLNCRFPEYRNFGVCSWAQGTSAVTKAQHLHLSHPSEVPRKGHVQQWEQFVSDWRSSHGCVLTFLAVWCFRFLPRWGMLTMLFLLLTQTFKSTSHLWLGANSLPCVVNWDACSLLGDTTHFLKVHYIMQETGVAVTLNPRKLHNFDLRDGRQQ